MPVIMRGVGIALALGLALAACMKQEDPPPDPATTKLKPPPGETVGGLDEDVNDFLGKLPKGADQLKAFCDRGGNDVPSIELCKTPTPEIHSLADFQRVLGLSFADESSNGGNGKGGNPGFVLTGHSSSLVSHFVSAINPRAIVFTPNPDPMPNPLFVAMSFVRGEQIVEVAAYDPIEDGGSVNLYLLQFEQACNATHCGPEDLLTPAIEENWTGWTLYEDEDLTNTVFDCTQCHQPNGPDSDKLLRMQEHLDPFTHFFKKDRIGGKALLDDFHAAHGTSERYGMIPAALIDESDPTELAKLLGRNGYADQPNAFPSPLIEAEVDASSPKQPIVNVPMGKSQTWEALYYAYVTGDAIPPPYHDVKVTDPSKLDAATQAYKAFLGGDPAPLTDIRDVFLDSALPDLGFRLPAGVEGKGLLVAACQQCHNDKLDPMVTRARFDVTKLDTMSRDEKDAAIARVRLPAGDPKRMPPARFRILTPGEIDQAVSELSK